MSELQSYIDAARTYAARDAGTPECQSAWHKLVLGPTRASELLLSADAELQRLGDQIATYESWHKECGNTSAGCCEQKRELQRLRAESELLRLKLNGEEAMRASLLEQQELLRRAVVWCLENGAKRPMFEMKELYSGPRILDRHNEELQVPPELAPVILGME